MTSLDRGRGVPLAAMTLMAASGFAGIGYQIVWMQQSALWMGHDSAAVLAVVTAFFGGIGLGSIAFGRRIAASLRPLRWYAACEFSIGAWGLWLVASMPTFSGAIQHLIGPESGALRQWTLAFCSTFVLLLPATAAMGATIPALERVVARFGSNQRSIGALYASNTCGAVLGVLAAAFWLVPTLGLVRTTLVCVVVNVGCAALAWGAARRQGEPAPTDAAALPAPARASATARRVALARLAASGLLGIGYEVMVVRVLSQVAEDTVYTFAMLLAVYLVGSALGAAAWYRCLASSRDPERVDGLLLGLLALACLAGTGSLWAAPSLNAAIVAAFGPGMGPALGGEAAMALAAFALPTFAMGAVFSHLCCRAQAVGLNFGVAIGANTLGCAVAPVLFGVAITPRFGAQLALLTVAAGYLVLSLRRGSPAPVTWLGAAATAAIALWAGPLVLVDLPDNGRLASYREGVMAAVAVTGDEEGVLRLRINNRQQEGSSATRLVDSRQALLPILMHPAPRRVLFLGLGTGVTASAAAQDSTLTVDAVELLPEVVAAASEFRSAADDDPVGARFHVITADARRYVRATEHRYDVIVSDNFHPARSGSGSLYTVEHFEAVRARLAEGGLFCQWLPLHQLDLETLRSIVASFVSVYPNGEAILASNSLETPVLGLVSRADDSRPGLDAVRERLAASRLPTPLAAFGIDDEYALLGSVVAGPTSLARFAQGAPANTDDRPVVAYLAPRVAYAPESAPRDRLIELMGQLSVEPAQVVADSADTPAARRLAAYWTARDRYLELGRGVTPSRDPAQMLRQVRDPLLSILRVSPDFRPAYDPLLRMAMAIAATDASAARALLNALSSAQPGRPEAAQALATLPAAPR
jgi:spermidine synthase